MTLNFLQKLSENRYTDKHVKLNKTIKNVMFFDKKINNIKKNIRIYLKKVSKISFYSQSVNI